MDEPHSYLTHLECADCGTQLPADREQHLCPACGGIATGSIRLASSPPRRAPRPYRRPPLGATVCGDTPSYCPWLEP